MNLYIKIQGGLGKNLSFLRIIKHLKKRYDKIYVCSPYWDVFQCSSLIDGVYKENETKDFIIEGSSSKNNYLVIENMYNMQEFVRKEINYDEAWCKLCGIEPEKSHEIILDKIEKVFPNTVKNCNKILEEIKDFKDFILVQFWGSQSPLDPVPENDWSKKPYSYYDEPLKRHYPIELAQEFVDKFKEKYPETAVIQYALPNEPAIEGCFYFLFPYLTYYHLAKNSKCRGFVAIDSSLQHLITGVKPGIVIWGHSLPDSFGYSENVNIIQKCDRSGIYYFTAIGPSGAQIEYCKPDEILKSISENMMN